MTPREARIVIVALAILATPHASSAQQTASIPRVGFLANGSAAAPSVPVDAFRQGLQDLGYVEGQNIVLEIRWAEGRLERLRDLAAELVQRKPDVLVTAGYQGIQAARRATSAIPIVMVACDPAETIVASIARPGGHITGVTCMSSDLTPKRLQLLKEAVPRISRVAVLYNPIDPNKAEEVRHMQVPARTLRVTLPVEARDPGEFETAIAAAARERADALFVLPDSLTVLQRQRIADLAAKYRLPAMYGFKEFVEAGGLMSYGTSMSDLFRRAAAHVDKVLRGANPGDVPVEQATRFELVLNLKTARALGLTIPQSTLVRADRVIQ